MKLFRGFAVASAALALVIAVLGSWVRINNAGLTCPDWPLCNGQLVPSLHGGIVLEWSHRLVAFVEGFVVLGAIATGLRARRSIAGVTRTLVALGVVFAMQVSLGGATVLLSNSPLSVMLHWGMGMLLLATLTTLAVLATLAPPRAAVLPRPASDGAAPALAIASGFAFVTMCIGAYVSSSYAGLACVTVPACDGTLLGHSPAQFVQMTHRLAAVAFAIVAAIATMVAYQSNSTRARAFATLGGTLVLAQIALGIGNVVWQLPTAMREAHAANACATFLAFVLATIFATLDPLRVAATARERAPAARPIATNA
ncbi:MAG: COX15/CtaA family protein [Vulcanimicrobiaceae bacterium]